MILAFVICLSLYILIMAAVLRSRFEAQSLTLNKYKIESARLEKGGALRLIFLSDLHGKSFGKENKRLTELIRGEKPDAILIGGDMIVFKNPQSGNYLKGFLSELSEIAPVYYAPGNHECRLENEKGHEREYRDFLNAVRESGAVYLKNETVSLGKGACLSGLDIPNRYYKKIAAGKIPPDLIAQSLGKTNDKSYNIVLAHTPRVFEKCEVKGRDLILSGHYHGGVMGLGGGRGLITPDFRLLCGHCKGLFFKDETDFIVTAGCGTHHINIRINNKPEIVLIELSNKT